MVTTTSFEIAVLFSVQITVAHYFSCVLMSINDKIMYTLFKVTWMTQNQGNHVGGYAKI